MKLFYYLCKPFVEMSKTPSYIWRKYALPYSFMHFGKKSSLGSGFTCKGSNNVYIGDNVSIGPNCVIYTTIAKTIINDNTIIGPGVTIVSGDHKYDVVGKTINQITDADKDGTEDKDIIFEGDNWIGANTTILKGVTIGRGAIVGACATVTKNVKPYSICAGTPAQIIKMRFTEEEIKKHEALLKKNSVSQSTTHNRTKQ
jgi:acetyltransferase-like isoleucine patch superfamily enzyme